MTRGGKWCLLISYFIEQKKPAAIGLNLSAFRLSPFVIVTLLVLFVWVSSRKTVGEDWRTGDAKSIVHRRHWQRHLVGRDLALSAEEEEQSWSSTVKEQTRATLKLTDSQERKTEYSFSGRKENEIWLEWIHMLITHKILLPIFSDLMYFNFLRSRSHQDNNMPLKPMLRFFFTSSTSFTAFALLSIATCTHSSRSRGM